MILTGKQIKELANFAGLIITEKHIDDEMLETEFDVWKDENGKYFVHYSEYPEEGGIELKLK